MDRSKRARLQARGWRIGDAAEFLGLSDAEAALIAMKLDLAAALRVRRGKFAWTQQELARRVGSSQSRVAKMEAGDPSVSLDLLVRTFLAVGASTREIGRIIGRRTA